MHNNRKRNVKVKKPLCELHLLRRYNQNEILFETKQYVQQLYNQQKAKKLLFFFKKKGPHLV